MVWINGLDKSEVVIVLLCRLVFISFIPVLKVRSCDRVFFMLNAGSSAHWTFRPPSLRLSTSLPCAKTANMKSNDISQVKGVAALVLLATSETMYVRCSSPLSNRIWLTTSLGLDPDCLLVLTTGSAPHFSSSTPIFKGATSTPTTSLRMALSCRPYYWVRQAKEVRDDWCFP